MAEPTSVITEWQQRFDRILSNKLELTRGSPGLLEEAMRYSATSGGKRMRPLLVYGAARAIGLAPERLDAVACAIEMIHAYSLIHDDLPAMDDDDLRRGRPTCHRAFDEATAILAGDALQALAFETLATDAELSRSPDRQVAIIARVARACGATGMAGGQVLDLSAVGHGLSVEQLEHMHQLKTGALIAVSALAPAVLAGSGDTLLQKLDRFGRAVGLAFQIHDDILDVTGDQETTGKSTQKDAAKHKPTFPGILGLDASRRRAGELRDRALAELRHFPGNVDALEWLAGYAIARES